MQTDELITWLNRAWGAEKEIKRLEAIRMDVFDRLTQTTGSYDKLAVRSSPDPHKLDGLAALDERVVDKINRKAAIQAEVLDAIDLLDDHRFRAILTDRYVRLMKWEAIEDEENYSRAHVFRLHRKAVAALCRMIKEEIE